ncbi:E3 ubiquitin-protein ligase RNF170 [Pimephales promelas]|nr:E3 ubiquitin-protein ligase RNF170 [Pimephales promelas]
MCRRCFLLSFVGVKVHLDHPPEPQSRKIRLSDPVLLVLVLSVTFLFGLAMLLCRNEQQRNHPENQEDVRVVREQLQSEEGSSAVLLGHVVSRVSPASGSACRDQLWASLLRSVYSYWRYRAWLGAFNCPICRQMVTLLFPLFHDAGPSAATADGQVEPVLILTDISDYNRRFSVQPHSLLDWLRDLMSIKQ